MFFWQYSILGAVVILAVVGIVYLVAMKRVRRELMDSPWLWGMIFSGNALLGLVTIGPKYDKREASVELKYIGRERAVPNDSPEINGGNVPSAEELRKMLQAELKRNSQLDTAPQEPPTSLIVPLWYLAGIIGIVFAGSAILLCRQLARENKDPESGTPLAVPTGSTSLPH